jgi:natural product biosynthesis luciferase-like monooxygenase protein
MNNLEELLGVTANGKPAPRKKQETSFSFLFFSDVRKDVSNARKYAFMKDVTLFGDREGFSAVYIPERHFSEFGSIYANSAVMAAYLIPQTKNIRFRTAGISLPLHHPAEIVEWWAMNDILSNGRVDLGFGSGWNKPDFVLAPDAYHDRRNICSAGIPIVQKLWRGETVVFPGVDGEDTPIQVFPRPVQKDVSIWLLVAQNDGAFEHAGRQGYNIFTMLYGINLEAMGKKIALYRKGRREAGLDPDTGIVSLMLHTLVHPQIELVASAVEKPFKEYIKSSMDAHVKAAKDQNIEAYNVTEEEKAKMLEYSYQRYFATGALFGSKEKVKETIDEAIAAGVNDIACLVDFGADYSIVLDSLPYLKNVVSDYI